MEKLNKNIDEITRAKKLNKNFVINVQKKILEFIKIF